ncbi:ECF transporter S component [Fructilactobacillus myrtifloralis]|uniref:Riboflavin transporter n=1 Tax=Fructilactobacillus myrtifloralis TaxID=2940301 RepID=A0ABY5BNX9_9LACO|nr:ECF transporter S component [Fructilactobacillus myrtifloralis]USS85378.1 ECF transporter S component [Fructilactobacillus myrtifloralis]
MKTNNQELKRMVAIAMLSAIAYLLMFVSFPILPYVPFLKLDFADVPILLGLLLLGPVGAVEITLLKLFLYWMTMGFSVIELVGLMGSLVASLLLIVSFTLLKSWLLAGKQKTVAAIAISAVVLALGMGLLNYFILMPVYLHVAGFQLSISLPKLILIGVIPFNLIKGALDGTLLVLIYGRLRHWIAHR